MIVGVAGVSGLGSSSWGRSAASAFAAETRVGQSGWPLALVASSAPRRISTGPTSPETVFAPGADARSFESAGFSRFSLLDPRGQRRGRAWDFDGGGPERRPGRDLLTRGRYVV